MRADEHIKVRDQIARYLEPSGGASFTRLGSKDVAHIFGIYDTVFFGGGLIKEIVAVDADLEFKVHARDSGYASVVSYNPTTSDYYIDIAPNVINAIFVRKGGVLPQAFGQSESDRLSVLMLVMEQAIVYLTMMLWGHLTLRNLDDPVYGVNGSLFQCVLPRWFGHSHFDKELSMCTVHIEALPRAPVGRYVYWSNSCYMDSLITVLLNSPSDWWRKTMLESDVQSQWTTTKHAVNICSKKSTIDTIPKVKDLATKIQVQLKEDLANLTSGVNIKCGGLRNLILRCIPKIKKDGVWTMFSAEQIYSTLANLFPASLLKIPYELHSWEHTLKTHINEGIQYRSEALLQTWDFMENPYKPVASFRLVRWDMCDSPVLVFYNGGTPRIKTLNKTGPERGATYAYGSKVKFSVNKLAAFGEYIIDRRYRLVGVLTLHGVDPKEEGGAHYTCYYRSGDKWIHYDDTSSRSTIVSELPESGVWVESEGSMPSMYFYEKVRNVDTVPPPTEVVAHTLGELEYQVKPSDDKFLLFVTDVSKGAKHTAALDALVPKPTTKVTETMRMWRVDRSVLKKLEESIKTIATVKEVHSEALTEIAKYGKYVLYQYSETTFALTGPKLDELKDDLEGLRGLGMNLKHGLGKGYVFPNSALKSVQTYLVA